MTLPAPENQLVDLVVHAMTGLWPEDFGDEDRAAWMQSAQAAIETVKNYPHQQSRSEV